jgi:uncharacterized protein involved in outer membrane biogenesis
VGRILRRIARYSAYGVAALVVLVVAAALVLPALLDTPRMRAEIQQKLSQAVKGEVRWEKFALRLLPSPRGSLRGLRVQTPAASASADEVTVALSFWPLLRGRPEITSVTLSHPVLRFAGPRRAKEEKPAQEAGKRALEAYRSAMQAVVDGLQQFAPDTRFAVEGAELSLRVEGVPPIELSALNAHARTGRRGLELDASAASGYWSAMKLAGRINYADLSSSAELDLSQVKVQAWLDWLLASQPITLALPSADLTARFRGDAAKALELEVDASAASAEIARGSQRIAIPGIGLKAKVVSDEKEVTLQVANATLGASGLSEGVLHYSPKDKSLTVDTGYGLDLAQALGYARQLAPPAMAKSLARVESASGALRGRMQLALAGKGRRFVVTVEQSDAALEVKGVPGPLRLDRATVEIDPQAAKVESAALSIPAGKLLLSTLRYSPADGAAAAKGEFDLDLERSLAVVSGLLPEEKRKALAIVESVHGRARGSVEVALSKKDWRVAVNVAKSDSQIQLRGLPGPAGLAGVSVLATPNAVTIERARVALLDSSASASVKITGFDKGPRLQGSIGEALVGPKLLDWVWQTAKLPAGAEPKAPIRIAIPRFTLGPKRALDLDARARFESGAALAVDVGWMSDSLDVRRAALKDEHSDVSVALRIRGKVLEGRYAGRLDGRSLAALLKAGATRRGAISGDLRFRFDRAQPRRTSGEGTLKGEDLDLSWLAGKPAKLERLDLSADDTGVRIAEASVEWGGQRATLHGTAKRSADGPVIDAVIDSPGIVVDALLPKKPAAPEKAAEKAPEKAADKAPKATRKPPAVWPLPVTGRIALNSQYVQYEHLKVAPVAAVLVLEARRAQLDLKEGQLCGIALPFALEATPEGVNVSTRLSAKKQPVEQMAKCLSGGKVLLTGTLDMNAELRTQGRLDQLAQNLTGRVDADLRNGQIMKFALIGNILSMKNIVALAAQGGPKLAAEGFPFRQLAAHGHFEKGRFVLDDAVFHSNAVGMGANGWISTTDYQCGLTVLVAPLALLDEAVRKLPLLGYVVGGSLTSLPVGVSGDIRDPLVVPLGPGAITSDLMGVLGRALSLPGQVAPPSAGTRR